MSGNGKRQAATTSVVSPRRAMRCLPGVSAISRQVGVDRLETINDREQVILDRVQSRDDCVGAFVARFPWLQGLAAVQEGRQVAGVPLQGDGERFERARASAALDRVALQLADDRLRDVR